MRIVTWVVLATLPACQLIVGNDEPNELLLDSLTVTGGLDQGFSPQTRTYTATPSYLDTVEVVPRSPDPDARIQVTSDVFPEESILAPSGTVHDVRVLAGDNRLTIRLTNPKGIATEYTVTVTVPGARFAAPEKIPLTGNPNKVKAADFTDDGKPDIVVCSNNGVFLFNGVTNAAIGLGSVGGAPCLDFAIGDVDNDTKNDLVIVNNSNVATVLRNMGTGTFHPPDTVVGNGGSNFISVALGLFDADDKLDVMIGDTPGGDLAQGRETWAIGNGNGTFGALLGPVFGAGGNPTTLLIGDFDEAPGVDAMVLDGAGGALAELQGNGAGAFARTGGTDTSPTVVVENAARSLVSLSADNVDTADFAVAHGDHNELAVIRNFAGAGTSSELAHDLFPTGAGPTSVTAADLDGDTHDDLIVTCRNEGIGDVTIFYGDGLGGFKPVSFKSPSPIATAVADVNDDDLPDLIVLSATSTEGVHVLLQEAK